MNPTATNRFMMELSDAARSSISATCLDRVQASMAKPVCVAMPILRGTEPPCAYQAVRSDLQAFRHRGNAVPFAEFDLVGADTGLGDVLTAKDVVFRCMALDTGSVEKVKDRVKAALWPTVPETDSTATDLGSSAQPSDEATARLQTALAGCNRIGLLKDIAAARHTRSLRNHCVFCSHRSSKTKAISTHSFDHGGGHFYRYRLCRDKMEHGRPSIGGDVESFLRSLQEDCPNHFFKTGPRISATRWAISPGTETLRGSNLPSLARLALAEPRFKGAHDNVEVYCLEHDPAALAAEIPVWWERDEMGPFANCFDRAGPLTGHIDLLMRRGGRLEIWDYKPDAERAETAGMQVFLYGLVLAVRASVPLDQVVCGYFDTEAAHCFSPAVAEMTRSG